MRPAHGLLALLALLATSKTPVLAGNPDLYDYDVPASFVSSLSIELNGSIGADINGDGAVDNALGAFLTTLRNLQPDLDPNPPLADAIENGSFALGCAWPTLGEDVADANGVEIHFFNLVDPDGDPSTRHEYRVDRASFAKGTQEPLIRFEDGAITGGELAAGPAQFRLSIVLGNVVLPVLVDLASLRGTVGTDTRGVTLTNGTLSGAIPVISLLEAFNGFLASDSCSCLGALNEPPIDLETLRCSSELDGGACTGNEELCGTFADFCSLLVLSFRSSADIDLDGDGEVDALSAFLHLTLDGTVLLGPSGPPDCNENGVADDQDIANGTSADINSDGIPDECVPPARAFHRGDANDSGSIELTDGIFILRFLFVLGAPAPTCRETADTNNSGGIELTDGVAVLRFLFQGTLPPAPPGPTDEPCGPDPDPPGSEGDLGCAEYRSC